MKKIFVVIIAFVMVFALAACGGSKTDSDKISSSTSGSSAGSQTTSGSSSESQNDKNIKPDATASGKKKSLVVYFSWSGNTEKVAKSIQSQTDSDIFEIVPKTPYSSDYNTVVADAKTEQQKKARPEISGKIDNIVDYDTVYVGFPNWWGDMPMILYTFFDTYDLSGKTVSLFCTSGGSGLSNTVNEVKSLEPNANVTEGLHIGSGSASAPDEAVKQWLEKIRAFNVSDSSSDETGEKNIKMTINGQTYFISLYDTPTANALYNSLPMKLNFTDYAGTEKIAYPDDKLPTEGEPDGCDPQEGDLCLYAPWGNLSVFYKDFRYSESLIKLGHIESGIEEIAAMSGDFSAVIEASDV